MSIFNSLLSGAAGLEIETGMWKPTTRVNRGYIPFTKQHQRAPEIIILSDVTGTNTGVPSNTVEAWAYIDLVALFGGDGIPYQYISSATNKFASAMYIFQYRGSSSSTATGVSGVCILSRDTDSDDNGSYPRYWATEAGFHPSGNRNQPAGSNAYYFDNNRVYEWIAIWT